MFMTTEKHVNSATSCSRCRFFSNRFAEENTSHGRIGYAGRILSESIGSRDDVNEEKLSSCSIRAENTDIHRLLAFVLAAIASTDKELERVDGITSTVIIA
jgi:hypothetical protein